MPPNSSIATLQKQIHQQERTVNNNWPIADFGTPEIDQKLPDNGFATGSLYEVIPNSYADFPAMLGFGMGMLSRILRKCNGHVLWVQPKDPVFEETRLYPMSLSSFGIDPDRVIHVNVSKAQHALWAIDEALAHNGIVAAVGLIPENDRTYDFTASRRLSMRAASQGTTALLFPREPKFAMSSAAEMRWLVATRPSVPRHRRGQAVPGVGTPHWHICIAKSRRGNTGHWYVEWNHETLSFRLATSLVNRTQNRISGIKTGQPAAA